MGQHGFQRRQRQLDKDVMPRVWCLSERGLRTMPLNAVCGLVGWKTILGKIG
jgi:hypothetical protein